MENEIFAIQAFEASAIESELLIYLLIAFVFGVMCGVLLTRKQKIFSDDEGVLRFLPAARREIMIRRDNLKLIEGIGPKIEEQLNKYGILSFNDLAKASIATLEVILKGNGERFAAHRPDSWPEQARLAESGDLESLGKLQKSLR